MQETFRTIWTPKNRKNVWRILGVIVALFILVKLVGCVAGAIKNRPKNLSKAVVVQKDSKKQQRVIKKEIPREEKRSQQEDVPVVKEPEPENQPVATMAAVKNFNGGFFKPSFDKQEKRDIVKFETGAAAIFKSNSGWEDGKYYCLHNTAAPGTIIKVTNITNGKSIYAKVLDVIPDIKQNNGLLIRISNAAAQELGTGGCRRLVLRMTARRLWPRSFHCCWHQRVTSYRAQDLCAPIAIFGNF